MKKLIGITVVLIAGILIFQNFVSTRPSEKSVVTPLPVTHVPETIDATCKKGRAFLYDECGSQSLHVQRAIDLAKQQNKTVIVNYGAEWCIWCHVFDAYIGGKSGKFAYKLEEDRYTIYERENDEDIKKAIALNQYVSENILVLHIESKFSPDGSRVLEEIGAAEHHYGGLPYIFSLDAEGRYAAHLPDWDSIPGLEVRRDTDDWYRGFDRSLLQVELQKLVNASM